MRTIKELKCLLTAGKPSPALKAATLLYLHGVGISTSTTLRVRDVDFASNPAKIVSDGSHTVYVTDELSSVLASLAAGKSDDDLLLGYDNVPEFHAAFEKPPQGEAPDTMKGSFPTPAIRIRLNLSRFSRLR